MMARFCDNCNKEIGFFSKKRIVIKDENSQTRSMTVCKACVKALESQIVIPKAKNLIDDPSQAQKLANALASDLALYNQKIINKGGDVIEVLRQEIAEGKALFDSRVTDEIVASEIYNTAIEEKLKK